MDEKRNVGAIHINISLACDMPHQAARNPEAKKVNSVDMVPRVIVMKKELLKITRAPL